MNAKRVIDLTQSAMGPNNNPAFPASRNELCMDYGDAGWMAEYVCAATHSGTHCDAPAHRIQGGDTLDDIPLDRFQGEALVVDLYHKRKDEEITPEDLAPYADRIRKNDIVLLCTGWGYKKDAEGSEAGEYVLHSPWLGADAARMLVKKGINAVAIDHFSIGGAGHAEPAHDILLGANVLIFEELFLPRELLEKERWYIVSFPMKNGSRSGSFMRTVALEFWTDGRR